MGFLGFFKKRRAKRVEPGKLPCEAGVECPYEYDKEPEREIEGMPFIDDDPRSCPTYGHICPEFMDVLGLTVGELKIRSTIHCGLIAKDQIAQGQLETSEALEILLEHLEETVTRYPADEYPQYY